MLTWMQVKEHYGFVIKPLDDMINRDNFQESVERVSDEISDFLEAKMFK